MNLTITDFFTHLLTQQNFYANVANGFQRIEVEGLGTMAIGIFNRRLAFFYDPAFVKAITMRLGIYVVEHEIVHAIMDHIARYLELLAGLDFDERPKAQPVMNIAVDCADNALLRRHRKNFPQVQQDFRDYLQMKNPDEPLPADAGMVLPENYGLPDLRSFEFYQYELMKQVKVLSKEDVEKLLGGSILVIGDSHTKWSNPGSEEGEKKDSDGKGTPKISDATPDLNTAMPQELEGLAQQIRAQLKQVLRKAVAEHKRNRGTVPAEIQEVLEAYLADPIVPWWDVLTSRVVASKRSKMDRGICRPNRTLMALAEEDVLIFPAIGKSRDPRYRVFFYADTSGSMSKASLYIALSELTHLLAADDDLEVRYMQGDCVTCFDQVYVSGDELPRDIFGRGGTDFNEYFRYMGKFFDDDETSPDLVIVYTDGCAPSVDLQNRLPAETPVIWLLTHDGSSHSLKGYGEVIVCSADYNNEYDLDDD